MSTTTTAAERAAARAARQARQAEEEAAAARQHQEDSSEDDGSSEDEESDGTELKINNLVEFPMEISDANRDKIIKKIEDTGFKPTLRKTRGNPGSNKGVPSPNYFFVPGA